MVGLTALSQTEVLLLISTLVFQITVLLAGGLLIATRYRHHAAIRYGITFTTLMLAVPLIVLSVLIQSTNKSMISMPVVPQSWVAGEQSVVQGTSIQQTTPATASAIVPSSEPAANSSATPARFDLPLALPAIATIKISLSKLLLTLWVIGLVIMLTKVIRGFSSVKRIQNSAGVLERNDLEHVLCLLGRDKARQYNIQFRESSEISSPVVAGVLQPMILLPTRFLWKLNNTQFRAILLHELGHIERRDTLANLLQKIVMALLWFHPLAYTLDKHISKAREEVCDNCVLAEQPALDYGEALLHARLATTHVPGKVTYIAGSIGIFGGNWHLEQRIKELIDVDRERTVNLDLEDKVGIYLSFGLLALVLSFSQISTASSEIEVNVEAATQEQLLASTSDPVPEFRNLIPVDYHPDADFMGSFAQMTQVATQPGQGMNRYNSSNGSWQQLYGQQSPSSAPPVRSTDVLSSSHRPIATNDLETIKAGLDALFDSRYEILSDFQRSTILNFYATYYSQFEDFPAAINMYEQMLSINTLSQDQKLRALRVLGELQWKGGNFSQAIGYYERWLNLSPERNSKVLVKLANSYMETKDYEKAMAILIEMQNADATTPSGGDTIQM